MSRTAVEATGRIPTVALEFGRRLSTPCNAGYSGTTMVSKARLGGNSMSFVRAVLALVVVSLFSMVASAQTTVCTDATIEKRLTTTRASTALTNDMEFPPKRAFDTIVVPEYPALQGVERRRPNSNATVGIRPVASTAVRLISRA